jgi:hypothetical protein
MEHRRDRPPADFGQMPLLFRCRYCNGLLHRVTEPGNVTPGCLTKTQIDHLLRQMGQFK